MRAVHLVVLGMEPSQVEHSWLASQLLWTYSSPVHPIDLGMVIPMVDGGGCMGWLGLWAHGHLDDAMAPMSL